jgi:TPP-dependent pyruvate/acetoin dehydrogenase alpha subunit
MADKMLSDPSYRGDNHFYAGQEAVATGVCAALRNDGPFDQIDLVYSSHRPTGHAIAKGVNMKAMCAENDFRATGLNGGDAAEVHRCDPTVATPHFHSTLNNARLLDLPLIYVAENNLYHQYAHCWYSCPHTDIAEAARVYGIPARVVDGQDVFQVYSTAKEAVDRARSGAGPTFIEAKTYRYYNHWGAPRRQGWRAGRLRLRSAGNYVPPRARGAQLDAARPGANRLSLSN